jgi:hypothetical protein
MSKLFFDHLIDFTEVDLEIKRSTSSKDEQEELWQLVDEMIHHRVLGYILGKLPQGSHEEFLARFHSAPYDEGLFDYLKEKIGQNVEELVREELGSLAFEILKEIGSKPAKNGKKR